MSTRFPRHPFRQNNKTDYGTALAGLHTTFGEAVGRFLEYGTHGYPPDVQRRLIVMNVIAYLIAVSTAVYAIQNIFMDFERFAPVIYINLAIVPCALLVPFAHRYSDTLGGAIILATEYTALLALTAYLGRESGLHLQYFIGIAGVFVVFGIARWKMILPIVVLTIALHLSAWYLFPSQTAFIKAEPAVLDSLYMQAAITTGALIAATVFYAFTLVERAKAETDALLRNILPDRIVARLNDGNAQLVADSFNDATILFADISGFVALARRLGAARTVALLNELVTEFDVLADRHGVEKIKTIGDAYMAACGIPEPVPKHTLRMADLAVDMLDVAQKISDDKNLDIQLRIGIASGPVMAGVIGTRKFSYDVWGDAVNLAARLENQSVPGRILVCPACQDALAATYVLEPLGQIDIKGVGLQNTFYLRERLKA
ncbi:MAG: adenylate/guanylate cyclase domain-containing protein [Pseudomonadota bacterium]